MTENKPVKVFRVGQIKSSIWKNVKKNNAGEDFDTHSATIVKSYKEGDNWKETTTFQVNDLPKLALVANKTFEYITLKEQ